MKFRNAGRVIVRQRLALSEAQALRLGERLVQMTAGVTPTYAYDIFRRNCVTELRDALFSAGLSEVKLPSAQHSYRQLLEASLREGWADVPMLLAMDLSAGRAFDAPALARDQLFLPELLSDAFCTPGDPIPVSTRRPEGAQSSARTHLGESEAVLLVFVALAALVSVSTSTPTAVRSLTRVLSAPVLGTLGLIVWTVAIATPNFGSNENMLALVPADYVLLSRSPRLRFNYSAMRLIFLAVFVVLDSLASTHPDRDPAGECGTDMGESGREQQLPSSFGPLMG